MFDDGDWIETKDQSSHGIRLVQTGNIGEGVFKNRGEKSRHISEDTFERLRCTEIFPTDCLISRLPEPVGRSCLLPDVGERMITGVDCTVVRFDPEAMLAPYFNYYSQSRDYLDAVDAETTGTTRKRISRSKLGQIDIPCPDIAEQRRIVEVLDEASAAIDLALGNSRQNTRNAGDLLRSHVSAILREGGEGWVTRRLGEVCKIARGGSPRPIEAFLTTRSDGINWVKIGDATASGKYITRTAEKIIPEGVKRSRMVHDGDLLLSNSMSFGRPYIMRTTGCIHDGWLVLSDYASTLDQDYLYHVLGSQVVYEQFDQLAAGSTVRNLNIDLAGSVLIPVPPMDRQREVANKLETMSTETTRLESITKKKLTALAELKQAVFAQAFQGSI